MASVIQDQVNLNEKYTLLCSEKCKLLNLIESVSRESKSITNEISILLDLISETKTDQELLEIDSDSESEMTFDPFYESFLNFTLKKRELEKCKSLQFEILYNLQKTEKKPKRKSPKKSKNNKTEDAHKEQGDSDLVQIHDEVKIISAN